ncbi:hypothetical protein CL619_03320 [archaeon]|nr:hypothetical protein [archaeon]|tara:strand:+ start:2908 stop:3627 length:720 start_codon:yes stop_codon:yes gene_type:complete
METIIPTILKIIGAVSGAGVPVFWLKSEAPDMYKLHEKNVTYAKKLADTHSHMVNKGFSEGVEKHLKDSDGNIDFSRLDDNDVQQDFTKTITDFYVKKIKDDHGMEAKDDFHKQMLLQAYAGITTSQLQDIVGNYGANLNYDLFSGRIAAQLTEGIRKNLYANASDHIKDSDIGGIVDKLGLKDKLRKGQQVTLEEARDLMNRHVTGGGLNESSLRDVLKKKYKGNPPKIKKDDDKKKK